MLIDMRNNQLVTKDSWKSKVPNSEESDSRSQMSQSPDSLTSFSLRLSDDEEEIEENDNTNINMRCSQQIPEFPKSKMENNIVKNTLPPPMKKQKIDDLCNGKESNAFKGVYFYEL